MNNFQKGMFDKIQKNSNIRPDEIYKVADSVKHADFSDEKTVRQLVRQLAKMANKPLSKEKEDKLVESIAKNNVPADMNSLDSLFKK
ncbi:stage VI sporulation protein F [Lentibacillus sediminis]|uniref:stage VI sporulation protein F n=1 Tax=Lentibacillus sediminis TaxID=1940529 RepID=UPI000C1B99DD|nr:stage VI sporulation protein F [Lentibacillus sediminis]